MQPQYDMIRAALGLPTDAIAYNVSQSLAALCPEKALIEGDASSFDLEEYARAGLCTLAAKPEAHHQITTRWNGTGRGLSDDTANAWYEVTWQGRTLDVLLMSWSSDGCRSRYYWITTDIKEVAETFFLAVCEWNAEVRGEILVFDGGYWYKSEELYEAIKAATFDNLILPPTLQDELQTDFQQFFQARDVYERYGIPWKRGVLFIGTPGNGKTHTVKALINWLGQPCLYVKSFKSRYGTDHSNIHQVFARARQTTPCLLVLEDLDSLIDDKNRSFFLNELDGFAANTGVVVLATTNHPERLDSAILERPSRFDRKYLFDLPAAPERKAFLSRWNDRLQPELRLSPNAVGQAVALTEGYSFAYLKELWLSSMMRWIATPIPGRMDALLTAQAGILREQMNANVEASTGGFVMDDSDE